MHYKRRTTTTNDRRHIVSKIRSNGCPKKFFIGWSYADSREGNGTYRLHNRFPCKTIQTWANITSANIINSSILKTVIETKKNQQSLGWADSTALHPKASVRFLVAERQRFTRVIAVINIYTLLATLLYQTLQLTLAKIRCGNSAMAVGKKFAFKIAPKPPQIETRIVNALSNGRLSSPIP